MEGYKYFIVPLEFKWQIYLLSHWKEMDLESTKLSWVWLIHVLELGGNVVTNSSSYVPN